MNAVLKLIIAMVIWGSLGVFVKNIPLESFEIAFLRAIIASGFLGIIFVINSKKEKTHIKNQKNVSKKDDNIKEKGAHNKDLGMLILSGIAIGFNWVFLFQSYKFTTISNATLSYYFAPVIVVFLSPILLKEKFTLKKLISVIAAMIGLFLILNNQSEVPQGNFDHIKGITIAFGAALFYATIVILNKYIKGFGDYERTFIQIFTASIVLFPFVIYRGLLKITDVKSLILILILGIVHTGIAYCLYFSAIKDLKAQSTALISYIDPVSAIFFSVVFLSEPLSIWQGIGGVIILISTLIAEKPDKNECAEVLE